MLYAVVKDCGVQTYSQGLRNAWSWGSLDIKPGKSISLDRGVKTA